MPHARPKPHARPALAASAAAFLAAAAVLLGDTPDTGVDCRKGLVEQRVALHYESTCPASISASEGTLRFTLPARASGDHAEAGLPIVDLALKKGGILAKSRTPLLQPADGDGLCSVKHIGLEFHALGVTCWPGLLVSNTPFELSCSYPAARQDAGDQNTFDDAATLPTPETDAQAFADADTAADRDASVEVPLDAHDGASGDAPGYTMRPCTLKFSPVDP